MKNCALRGTAARRKWSILLSYFLIFSFSQSLQAQETFTERLQKPVAGQGTVRLWQDAEIAALANGKRQTVIAPTRVQTPDTTHLTHNNVDTLMLGTGRKVRMNGYRVQVYAGGNSRDAKHRAYQMEGLVRSKFPDQPVYTRFVSPRWICHVGDFQTREEALQLLQEMRKVGGFSEAITVKCKISTIVYE